MKHALAAVCTLILSPWLALAETGRQIDAVLEFPKRVANSVFRSQITPHWLPGESSFWYSVQTGPQATEFVLIEAESGARRTARTLGDLNPGPSASKVHSNLTQSDGPTLPQGKACTLTFVNELGTAVNLFWIKSRDSLVPYGEIRAGESRVQPTYENHVWRLATPEGETLLNFSTPAASQKIRITAAAIEGSPVPRQPARGAASPNSQWNAVLERNSVSVIDAESGAPIPIKAELETGLQFHGPPEWSPDSKAFVLSASAPLAPRKVTLVQSLPNDQIQPTQRLLDYNKPGDPLPQPFPVLFTHRKGLWSAVKIQPHMFPNAFTEKHSTDIRWAPNGSEFYFDYNQRGHQLYRILAVDAATGRVRIVVEETSRTFIDHTKKTWRRWLDAAGELLWMSERDGWCHLWLYDIATGSVKQQVTSGRWVVREVLHIDESLREIWFLASGLRQGEDPYHRHLCRIKMDGTGFLRLTEADADHQVRFSPGRKYFTTRYARADLPPVHELRRSADGALVCILEKADASRLFTAGWTAPERFVAKGRDGTTDIHGIIIKPSHFDPSKSYPVLEEVYAGPHSASVSRNFDLLTRPHQLAELGFIVVKADGMGTDYRGKAFHETCWKNLKDAGFADRITWIRAAAKSRPWMDLERVGIFGGSAGGQNAMRALLDHHPFYKAAVADCGCHDNRLDKLWWNEQWMGWPVGKEYADSSNVVDAHKLEGSLLLIAGELDSNVDPSSTMQVVGALQKAGKRFEYMPIVNTGHGAAETAFGMRLRMEFFARHLLAKPHPE